MNPLRYYRARLGGHLQYMQNLYGLRTPWQRCHERVLRAKMRGHGVSVREVDRSLKVLRTRWRQAYRSLAHGRTMRGNGYLNAKE